MSIYTNAVFIALLFSVISTIIMTPQLKVVGDKYNLRDIPNKRGQHSLPKIRIGGISIFLSFLISIISSFVYLYFNNFGIDSLNKIFLGFCGLFILFILGLLDDLFKLSPYLRLACQLITSAGFWLGGIRIESIDIGNFSTQFYSLNLSPILSLAITVFWITGLTNAFNWIDGLDGLASGLTSIICITFIFISFSINNYLLAILFISLLGSNIGFLKYNYFPSSIMMGDSGSYFLGSTLSILSLLILPRGEFNLLIYGLIFLIPIGDMIAVIFSRISSGISPFFPDRRHLHHRILSLGLNHHQTVLFLYLIKINLCSNLLYFLGLFNFGLTLLLNIFSLFLLFTLLNKNKKNPKLD